MAGSTSYDVIVGFRTEGDLEGAISGAVTKTGGLHRAAEGVSGAFGKVGAVFEAGFMGPMDSIMGRIKSFAFGLPGLLGLTSFATGVGYGVKGLNSELEISKNSIAAVLNAQGVTATMPEGLARAGRLVEKMKIDARDLPGEFQDLFGIFQTGIGSALQAGLSDDTFRQLSATTMAASKALAVPMQQAGRELSRLLMGSAGMDNTLGMRLGLDADKTYKDLDGIEKKFRELSAPGRANLIQEKLGKFQPSIEAFGKTFDAQWSTLIDNGKQFLGLATSPLFEKAKEALADINDWFTKNQDTVQLYAQRVGIMLSKGFDEGKRIALEWGPLLYEYATKTMIRLENGWAKISPYIDSAIGASKGLFTDVDGTLDKIEMILKLYIAAKVAGPLLSLGGSAVGSLGGMSGIGGWMSGAGSSVAGLFRGLGAAGGAASALGGTASLAEVNAAFAAKEMSQFTSSLRWTSAASSGVAGAAGKAGAWASGLGAEATGGLAALGTQAAAAGTALTALTAAVPVAAVAAIGDAAYEIYDARTKAQQYDAGPRGGHSEGGAKQASILVREAIDAGSKLRYSFDDTYEGFGRITSVIDTTGTAADELGARLRSLAADADYASIALVNAGLQAKQQEDLFAKDAADIGTAALGSLTATVTAAALAATEPAKKEEKKKPSAGGGQVINGNINVTVTSAAEPGQIVRLTLAEIAKLRRRPGSSPDVRNFSAGRT